MSRSTSRAHTWGRRPALLIATAAAVGCSDASATAPTAPAALASSDVVVAIETALQDEYRAAATYEAVLAQLGSVLPFANIVQAERQHAASLAGRLVARGLTPPPAVPLATVPTFASREAACAAGATAEVENIALYDSLLTMELPADVAIVFENNRRASLEGHLPAFTRCGTPWWGNR